MTYDELLEGLAVGELKNTNVVKDGEIDPVHETMIRNHTNRGLVKLFSRFVLSKKQVIIEANLPIVTYHLRKDYARTSSAEVPFKYIADSIYDPFMGDVTTILAVFDSDGCELPLNDLENEESVFTAEVDTLQLPNIFEGQLFDVVYQALHPKILPDIQNQPIWLPEFLFEALQAYVAGKVLSHMNGQEHSLKGQEYMALFDQICTEAEVRNIAFTSTNTTTTKLYDRGFV